MTAPLPTFYRVDGLPFETLLCFRTQVDGGRVLLSLVPDVEEQHPLDVVSIFLDDPRLVAVDAEGEPLGSRAREPEAMQAARETGS